MLRGNEYNVRCMNQRISYAADKAEYRSILYNGVSHVRDGIYNDEIADAMDDFSPPPSEPNKHSSWEEKDLQLDSAVGGIHETIVKRQELLGESYPFTLDGQQLIYRPSKSKIYEFCLAISNSRNITRNPYTGLPRLFERISAELVRVHLGANAKAFHSGFPRDGEISFKEAMRVLADSTREWFWKPETDIPEDGGAEKDGGMDFAAWIPSPDKRQGQIFVLGQCACGNDWICKWNDLNLSRLQKWFHPMLILNPPIRAFATPFHINDALLKESIREAGLVFDRIRLTLIGESSGLTVNQLPMYNGRGIESLIEFVLSQAA
ncbi:MAG: hypothetical protein HQL57_02810 [Magnetococcales bacterium]|nr:hypothetical protein [Magnetococcales bacterium]MBF0156099.1 hypothetical protein [Magnetococcales bacterium]